MHTVIVVGAGLLLLALCLLIGRLAAGRSGLIRACIVFVPLWFIGAAINMYIGVVQAGYSVADEAPMFLLVFSVPVIVALALRRSRSSR